MILETEGGALKAQEKSWGTGVWSADLTGLRVGVTLNRLGHRACIPLVRQRRALKTCGVSLKRLEAWAQGMASWQLPCRMKLIQKGRGLRGWKVSETSTVIKDLFSALPMWNMAKCYEILEPVKHTEAVSGNEGDSSVAGVRTEGLGSRWVHVQPKKGQDWIRGKRVRWSKLWGQQRQWWGGRINLYAICLTSQEGTCEWLWECYLDR